MKKFNKADAISVGWKKFQENWKFFIVTILGVWILFIILGNSLSPLTAHNSVLTFISRIIINILEALIGFGFIRVALDVIDNKKINLSKIYTSKEKIFHYVIASILYFIMVFVGFILLIIPGIYLGIKYHFFMYEIVDKNAGVMNSFKNSSKITHGNMMNLFLFGLICFGIFLLGLFLLGVGLLAAIPVIMLSTAYVYRKLS